TRLFRGEREELSAAHRARRALFVNQIVAPAALGLLALYEQVDLRRPPEPKSLRLRDLLPPDHHVAADVKAYVEGAARAGGADAFDVLDVGIAFDPDRMRRAVTPALRSAFEHLCDVVREYDCDLLLLTGRPSRLPIVRELALAQAPVQV